MSLIRFFTRCCSRRHPQASIHPGDHSLVEMKRTEIEIAIHDTKESESVAYQRSRKKLSQAISLIKKHAFKERKLKTHLPAFVFVPLGLGLGIGSLIRYLSFQRLHAEYVTTRANYTYENQTYSDYCNHVIYSSQLILSPDINVTTAWFELDPESLDKDNLFCADFVDNIYSFSDNLSVCIKLLKDLCNASSALSNLVVPLSILITLSMASCLYSTRPYCKKTFTRADEIRQIATENDITLAQTNNFDDHADLILSNLREGRNRLDQLHRNYLSRSVFVFGFADKESKSPIKFLGDKKLAQTIFEFADMDKQNSGEKKRRRKAFFDATHDKNRHTSLHKFLNKLNTTNKENENFYDKEFVLNKIFSYV